MADIRIGVSGCGGRMGRMVALEALETKGCRLAGGIEAPGSPYLGRDLGELAGVGALKLKAGSDALALFRASDVVIDFSSPAAGAGHAKFAAATGKALVIGTTGLDAKQMDALKQAAKKTAIVWAPNMSIGVNLLLRLVQGGGQAAGRGLRPRNPGDAPPAQGRRAFGHGAGAGPRRGRGPRRRPRQEKPEIGGRTA